MKNETRSKLPDYKTPFQLSEEQTVMVNRLKEELADRVGIPVSIAVYNRNYLIHPAPTGGSITFEVQVGNWRTVQVISEVELDYMAGYYRFLRRIVDRTMGDLIRIGAQRA